MKRVVLIVLVLGLLGFALEGGTYGTRDLLRMKSQVREEKARIARLRRDVDSLGRIERALKNDPVTQERVAREVYGMIKPGEILYQVVPKDSAR